MTEAPAIDLTDFITAVVAKQTSEAAIRERVEKNIDKIIADAIDGAFRYGDTRKQIEDAVKASLAIDRPLDLPTHGAMIMAILREKIGTQVNDLVAAKLSAEMDEILGMAPKEVKLTQLVDLMRKDIDEHDRYGTYMTCIVEESEYVPGNHRIYLDPDADKRMYDCDLQLAVDKDGKIYSISCNGKDPKTKIVMGWQKPYQKLALAAYCGASKFIIDDTDPSTGIGDF